jgi:hypothetical protein
VILFEFTSSRYVTVGSPIVDEVRPCPPWIYFLAGSRSEEKAHLWADEIESLVRQYGGKNRRLAVDRCDPAGAARLLSHGVELFDGQEVAERARMVKSAEEIACLQSAMEVCDLGGWQDARGARARDHRKPAVVDPPRDQYRSRRRMDRVPLAVLGSAHQPVVPGVRQ